MIKLKDWMRSLLNIVNQNSFTRNCLLQMAKFGLLPKFIWKRLPVERMFLVSLSKEQNFKYAATANDYVGNYLFWRGVESYETETIRVFQKLAQRSNLILDIGANTGLFTLVALAANLNSKVISFEPVLNTYERLVTQVKINGWENRCHTYNQAVSNIVGETKLHVPLGECLALSASLNPDGFRGYEGFLIDIPVTTIDTLCSNEHIDLVKIDVEGFEDKVLEGMQQVLSNSAPDLIIECNCDGPFLNIENLLAKFGYQFFHLRAAGPVAVDKIVPDEKQLYRNFLCSVRHDWSRL